MPNTLEQMVNKQVSRVLRRGTRQERFDQLRSRHFWSSYMFVADSTSLTIQAGFYDLFKASVSQVGQGYPTNVPLTVRETNWLNSGRVPDNQNFVITEIGVTLKRPPAVDGDGVDGIPLNAPSNGIWANMTAAQQLGVGGLAANAGAQSREINPADAIAILYGIVLEMSFLTNNVPLGLCSDFSQSGGNYTFSNASTGSNTGDPSNGLPCAAFRRKLEVPILLQHGENMGMRLNVPRNIQVQSPALTAGNQGTLWFEIRVDWWAHESFAEKS